MINIKFVTLILFLTYREKLEKADDTKNGYS